MTNKIKCFIKGYEGIFTMKGKEMFNNIFIYKNTKTGKTLKFNQVKYSRYIQDGLIKEIIPKK